MPEITGQNAFAQWIHSGGTVTLSSDYRQLNDQPSVDLVDFTAGNDTYKTYGVAHKDGQLSLTILAQAGGTVLISALAEGASGTIIFGEEGTAVGKPKTTFPAISMGPQRNTPYNNVVEISVTFQQNGTREYGVY
jgi:hypothetical protein